MLFLEKTDVKKISEVCEGIANGSRALSAEDIVVFDLFHSRIKSIIGVKVAEKLPKLFTLLRNGSFLS